MKFPRFGAILLFLVLSKAGNIVAFAQPGDVPTLHLWMEASDQRVPGYYLMVDMFNEAHDDIHIEFTRIAGSWEEQYEQLLIAYAAGVAPDIMYGKGYWMWDFAPRGMLLDLTPYWSRDKHLLEANPRFHDLIEAGSTYQGRVYGLPRGSYWYVLGYNIRMFNEAGLAGPPDTWEEFRQVGRLLTDPERNIYGFQPDSYTRSDSVFVEVWLDTWTRQLGGSIMTIDEDGWPVYTLTSPEAVEAFEFAVDNVYDWQFARPSDAPSGTEFLHGHVGMRWMHGGQATDWTHQYPELEISTGIMPRNVNRWTYIADNKLMVNSQTPYPDQAWEFLRFVSSQETEAVIAPYEGHLSSWTENWVVHEHPAYDALIEQLLLPETHPLIGHAGYETVRAAITVELKRAVMGDIPPIQALENAQQAADLVLAELKAQFERRR